MKQETAAGLGVMVFIMALIGAITLGMWGCPQYNIYSQRMEGEALLAHAEYSKQTQVMDAHGKLEAAKSLAQVDVERAKGVAEANKIIGQSLQNNEAYIRWLYIEGLKEKTGDQVIYVPTEAGLPVLEAGKRK